MDIFLFGPPLRLQAFNSSTSSSLLQWNIQGNHSGPRLCHTKPRSFVIVIPRVPIVLHPKTCLAYRNI
jgi:hypothetical protein